jgi:hypothetical protein
MIVEAGSAITLRGSGNDEAKLHASKSLQQMQIGGQIHVVWDPFFSIAWAWMDRGGIFLSDIKTQQ